MDGFVPTLAEGLMLLLAVIIGLVIAYIAVVWKDGEWV